MKLSAGEKSDPGKRIRHQSGGISPKVKYGIEHIFGKMGEDVMFFKRAAIAILGLAVVISFWVPATRAQVAYSSVGTSAMILSSVGGGFVSGGGGTPSVVPPAGAITSTQAIAAVTKYFTPPEGATVNANYSGNQFFNGKQSPTWNINWFVESSGPSSGEAAESMWASVDAMTGRILNFSGQSPPGASKQGSSGKTYSYQQALTTARQMMAELAPEAVGRVELETTPSSYGFADNYDYQFNFVRLANGLPVWGWGQPEGVDIGVNVRTDEVDSYMFNWLTGLNFPSPNASLDVTRATYDWWNTAGLELNYILPHSPVSGLGASNKVKLAYVLKDGGLFVDAGSGGILDDFGQPYQPAVGTIPAPAVPLSSPPPGGLSSSAAALAWAQKILPIPDGYNIADVGQGQMTGPTGQTRQVWNLSWSTGQEQGPFGVSAAFLADSGQLADYHVMPGPGGTPGSIGENETAVSRGQALQKAVDFVAGAAGINLSGYRLNQPAYVDLAGSQGEYSFVFDPTPNGIPLGMDDLYMNVSSATGQVLNFNQPSYVPATLPSSQGIMSMAQARDIFNKDITLQLGYLIPGGPGAAANSQAPVLVYGLPAHFTGAVIDAVTGEVTDQEGTNLLLGSGPPADVAGSWAAGHIELVLQRHLMSVDAQGLFHPQDPVTRGEAVAMLLAALNGYQLQASPSGVDFSDVPAGSTWYGVVETAYRMGMVAKAANFHPDDPVTRQDFAVMAVRALKYDAIGKMALRIPLPYRDAALVNPVEANYVALAAGLGIFGSGSDFRPLDPLTRAEAAMVLVRMPSLR